MNMSETPEYRAWSGMKQRCLNKNLKAYKDYGARGIRVCESWINSFELFLKDMGIRPSPNHSLDRIDVNGNYDPSNCRWAEPKTQNRNMRVHLKDDVGVSFSAKYKSWTAFITVDHKTVRCGSFKSKSEAISARKIAEQKLWVNGEKLLEPGDLQKNNTSGYKGVAWEKRLSKWHAYAYLNKKRIFLGRFEKIEDAVRARESYAHGITAPVAEGK